MGALDGLSVVEVASYVSGPYAAMLLADLGATVIKVEPPNTGDPYRGWGRVDYSPPFGSLNRNKQSVTIDLKSAEGRADLRRLVASADVLLENFRPGTMARWNLAYDDLRGPNPRLIYCSITGFGTGGPYGNLPGYDTVGQAMSGLLSVLTDLSDPKPMGISLSDHLSGIFACYGIMAAVIARARTGRGQLVETSLLQSTIAFLGENAAGFFERGSAPSRATRTHSAQVFAFVAGDGQPFVVHLSSPPKFWEGLTRAIDRIDLQDDPRFVKRPQRQKHYDELHAILTLIFRTGDRADWLARLRAEDVPCGPLYDLAGVFEDPQVQHLGMVHELPHSLRGTVRVVGSGVTLSDTPVELRHAAPELGIDNVRVLGSELPAKASAG
jgi:crotonobetainyl-CoA:carnitine CoA-transferase CaiB-like acyl-CoA transferase